MFLWGRTIRGNWPFCVVWNQFSSRWRLVFSVSLSEPGILGVTVILLMFHNFLLMDLEKSVTCQCIWTVRKDSTLRLCRALSSTAVPRPPAALQPFSAAPMSWRHSIKWCSLLLHNWDFAVDLLWILMWIDLEIDKWGVGWGHNPQAENR